MNDAPILICYDGSDDAARGIQTAAKLFGARRAVVLDVALLVLVGFVVVTAAALVGALRRRGASSGEVALA